MNKLALYGIICMLLLLAPYLVSDELTLDYQILDRTEFEKIVVGNTIVGITRQSQSLYMLYFLPDQTCQLWKQNKIYCGNWWIENDSKGRDLIRAFWPSYKSIERSSLFSPEHPNYGKPTAIRYYRNKQNGIFLVAGKNFQSPVLLVPNCPFQNSVISSNFQ